MAPLTADLFGAKNLGVNFGIMFLTIAVAAYVGPLLVALIKAGSGSYTQAFITAAFINLAGFVLFGAFILYKNRLLNKRNEIASGILIPEASESPDLS